MKLMKHVSVKKKGDQCDVCHNRHISYSYHFSYYNQIKLKFFFKW